MCDVNPSMVVYTRIITSIHVWSHILTELHEIPDAMFARVIQTRSLSFYPLKSTIIIIGVKDGMRFSVSRF